ncbi:MAG: hypothetical protein WCC59_04830 [Terriglobales bacterium]
MKPTKLMLGTMILGLGMAGTAWAQPAPGHDRDAAEHGNSTTDRGGANRARGDAWRGDRDDVYRGGYNPYVYRRGDGDRDRDDRNVWRGDRDARRSWNWGHSDMRRGKTDDR